MTSFKQYVTERILTEKGKSEVNADVIYQKMLDVLDNAHIDFDEDMIGFHLGRIIKNSNIDISVVIRVEDRDSVRLGRNKDTDGLTIVVGTRKELPARTEIDAFLSKDRARAQKVKGFISQYLSEFYGDQDPSLITTKYEEEVEANSSIDDRYEKLATQLRDRISDYSGMIEELQADMDTADTGKREMAQRAMKHLGKEQFGDTLEEFKKIALKLFGVSKLMSKENKDKLANRLDSFYDQKIKPLLAK